jgi:hypothetical protein
VLPYNKLIRLLTPDPPFRERPAEGRTLGPLFGTTIGEAIILSNERLLDKSASEHFTKEYAPSLKFQFSRSILWGTYGNFESLRGLSGYPLELVQDETEDENHIRRVVGFQNFEWKHHQNFPSAHTAGWDQWLITMQEQLGGC